MEWLRLDYKICWNGIWLTISITVGILQYQRWYMPYQLWMVEYWPTMALIMGHRD